MASENTADMAPPPENVNPYPVTATLNIPLHADTLLAIKNNSGRDTPEMRSIMSSTREAITSAASNYGEPNGDGTFDAGNNTLASVRSVLPVAKGCFMICIENAKTGSHREIEVCKQTTLKELMKIIEGYEGIPKKSMRLVFQGRVLCEHRHGSVGFPLFYNLGSARIEAGDKVVVLEKKKA